MNWSEIGLDILVVNDLSAEEQLSLRDYLINLDEEKRKEWYKENSRYRNELKAKKYEENPEYKKEVYAKASKTKTGMHYNMSKEAKKSRNKKVSESYHNKTEEEKVCIQQKISKSQKARYSKFTKEDWKKYSEIHSECLINRTPEEKKETSIKICQSWHNKSKEEQDSINKKRSISNKLTWENKTEEEMLEYSKKQKEIHANFSEEKKQKIAKQISDSLHLYFDNLTEDELTEIRTRRIENYLKWWHSLTEDQREVHRELARKNGKEGFYKYLDRIGGIEIHKKKCHDAYYNLSDEAIQLIAIRHRNYYTNMTIEEMEEYRLKRKLHGWKSFSEEKQHNILYKQHLTRKLNGSYGKSLLEDNIFNILIKTYNIEQCVRLDKYNYDFRIIYNDEITYIDIHGGFYHHYRPYTNSEKDKEEYILMKESSPALSTIADTWKIRDVERCEYCMKNNINYIRYYIDGEIDLIGYNEIVHNITNNLNSGLVTLFY